MFRVDNGNAAMSFGPSQNEFQHLFNDGLGFIILGHFLELL